MIDAKDFAKNITEIFNTQLGLRNKYDLTTRLICEVLDAATVSLLLYDGREDSLKCYGCHINIEKSNFRSDIKEYRDIINNISVYDFLKNKKKIGTEEDYKSVFKEYKNNCPFFLKISEEKFKNIMDNYVQNHGYYARYKEVFKKESYAINDDSITGNYFKELLNTNDIFSNKYKIQNLDGMPSSYKKCCTLLNEEVGIQIVENGFYIGLPLYATERYFGIIRILYPCQQDFIIRDDLGEYLFTEEYTERLGYFSQLISLHLETNYYLDGYKKLALIYETINTKTISNLRRTCDLLNEIVNCNGTIIRLYDEKTEQPEINGYTKSLSDYVKFIRTFNDSEFPTTNKFSSSLVDLFNSDESIVAVNFDIESDKNRCVKVYSIEEGYSIKDYVSDIKIIDLESKVFKSKLYELNINQITVVPIPKIKEGYMIFTNTKNRDFIRADIEMIILAANGIGLEINHIYDSKTIKEQEKEIVQTESMRNLVHQFAAPLNGVLLHVDNIVNDRVPEYIFKDRLSTVFNMLRNSIRQIKRFQRILELDTKPIIEIKQKNLNIRRYLIGKSTIFQPIASTKGIRIHVYSSTSNIDDYIKIDDELFDEVINNLIDNAVKYSFTKEQLLEKGIKYDGINFNSPGNILIYYSMENERTVIQVTNWGAEILKSETEKIFERYFRGFNANKFSPIGSGIGLFLVKKILTALKSKIEVSSDLYKTTFTITLKNK